MKECPTCKRPTVPVSGLDERIKKLRRALTMYADPSEWSKERVDRRWQLLFNSRDVDGDGWDIAAKALQEDNSCKS